MKALPRALLLGLAASLLGAALYLGCGGKPAAEPVRPPEPPSAEAPAPEAPTVIQPPTRYHDGRGWKSALWASDEMQVLLAPGADHARALPAAAVFTRSDGEAGVRISPAADRAAFEALARAWEGRPGIREVRPVFYESSDGLAKRAAAGRRILTRQVAATLPEGADPQAVAARHGARVLSKLDFLPRTWLLEGGGPFGALDLAAALREQEGLDFAAPQFARLLSRKRPSALLPNDPLFGQQWHLRNTGQGGGTAGEDINAAPAWDVALGTGVVIGIVDDGLERTHPDLAPNYSAALSIDINFGDADPTPGILDEHGTACAGLAGARGNNGLGVSGAAPQATLAGIRLTAAAWTDAQEAQAMSHQNAAIAVKSNSWGPVDDGATLDRPGPLMEAALQDGGVNGRGGLGVVYVWAGGNGRTAFDNANFDGYANHRHAIGVTAVSRQGRQTTYSEPGANLLVAAPGGLADITTTDLLAAGGYRSDFDGTSAAAPIVAGVVALMLEVDPNLSARDVVHILARTARKNHPGDGSWTTNGAGFSLNPRYGFGVVDAAAAVELAGRWPYAGPVASRSAASGALSVAIPDGAPSTPVVRTLEITGSPFRVEHVEVDFSATHPYRGDLVVTLVAPSGTRSALATRRPGDGGGDFDAWTFQSRRHLGEPAVGTWTIEVADAAADDVGTFTGWTLRVFGTPVDATAPVAGLVNDGPGADLDVHDSVSSLDANWSGFSDPESGLVFEWAIGTTAGGGEVRPFMSVGHATGASAAGLALSGGVRYYVSVRATNFDGLSTTVSSNGFMLESLPPDAPAAPAVSPAFSASGLFSLAWSVPADPGGTGVAGYDVQRSKDGGPFALVAAGLASPAHVDDASAAGEGVFAYAVRAVDAAGNVGAFSPAVAVTYDPTPPAVAIAAPPPISTPLSLSGTSADAVGVVAVTWVNAATGEGGAASGTSSWSASVPLAPGSNVVTVFAWDAAGNAGTAQVTIVFTPADLLPPSLTISAPTGGSTFSTATTPIALQGALSDDTGAASLEWENRTTGTRGAAAVAAFWTISVPLLAGDNLIVVTARDAAGNAASDALRVTFTPAADAVAPSVAIAAPTSSAAFATSVSPLALGGTASDDVALALVRWSNAATGGGATASGLASWTASIALAPGENQITATAVDASGNVAADVLTVTFTPAGGDAIPPVVLVQSPTSAAKFGTSSALVLLAGLASDDGGEVVELIWTNAATGASGTAAGRGAWSAAVPLASGANPITLSAYDAAGNAGSVLVTVTLGGSGGGGGCGATGLEVLLLGLLRRRRRLRPA